MEHFIDAFKKAFVLSGRTSRQGYWMFYLFVIIFSVAAGFAIGLLMALGGADEETVDSVAGLLNIVVTLTFLVPNITCGVRRLHDTGRSGWWLLIPLLNIVLLCFKGDEGENEYGKPTEK